MESEDSMALLALLWVGWEHQCEITMLVRNASDKCRGITTAMLAGIMQLVSD